MEREKLLKLCEKYLRDIAFAAQLSNLAGVAVYCSANTDRVKTHEAICELLGVDHFDERVKSITDRLDISIGFFLDKEYCDVEFDKFSTILAEKLIDVVRA